MVLIGKCYIRLQAVSTQGKSGQLQGIRMRDIFTWVTTELNVGTLLINTLKAV